MREEDDDMVDSLLDQVLGNIDPKILFICAAILIICFILAVIKKAIMIIIITAILALGCVFLVPKVQEYQDSFYIQVNDDNQLEIMVAGNLLTLGGEESTLKKVEMERQTSGQYVLEMTYDDGAIGKYTIPGFMRAPVLKYFDSNEIEYKLIE